MADLIPDPEHEAAVTALASYRDGAHESFVPPPVQQVAARARRGTRQRALLATAAAVAAVVVGGVAMLAYPDRAPDPAQRTDRTAAPAPSATSPAGPAPSRSVASQSPSASPSRSIPAAAVSVRVSPQAVVQGGRVDIAAGCGIESLRSGYTSYADSTALGKVFLEQYSAGTHSGAGTVRGDARPGEHVVTVRCGDGRTGRATFTVVTAQPSAPTSTQTG